MSNSPLPISNLPNVQSTGLKPNDLLVVVNYDLPEKKETYIEYVNCWLV